MPVSRLAIADEGLHGPGPESNWNESRYLDFYDTDGGIGGWLRIGMRPNEGHAEMSVCVHLPDGRTAFQFDRTPIDANSLGAGGQTWAIDDPYIVNTVAYDGSMTVLPDAWMLTEPRKAFAESPREEVQLRLRVESAGLDAVMGSDQRHVDLIFLPGQAHWHYQHLCWTEGTIRVGDTTFVVRGAGGKDHSWGPRNWLAKIYLRWLSAATADRSFGFMVQRAVGPTKEVLGGHVWADGRFHLADDIEMRNTYEPEGPYRLQRTELRIQAGGREWLATGTPTDWLPLRHRSPDEHGRPALLRIVKSPTTWTFGDGRTGAGMAEFHDRLDDGGVPAGLHD